MFIPNDCKLEKADDFVKGTNQMLKSSRLTVAWAAVGIAVGAYDACIEYINK